MIGAAQRTTRARRTGAIATALALLALPACGGDRPASGDEASPAPEPAPAYEAVALDGGPVSLAELRGQVVLLNVWATWCVPCRQEVPELQALHEEHAAEGLHVVGVTVDSRSADEDIRRFIEDFGMTYDIWWDPDQMAVSTFGAVGVPLTVLIDAEGRIVWRHLGAFQRGDPELMQAVEAALAAAPPAAGDGGGRPTPGSSASADG